MSLMMIFIRTLIGSIEMRALSHGECVGVSDYASGFKLLPLVSVLLGVYRRLSYISKVSA